MIVPMKKASIIILAQDTQATLKELRKLGVLHIEHQRLPQGRDITLIKEEIVLLDEAMDILMQTDTSCPFSLEDTQGEVDDGKHISQHIIDTHKRIEHLQEYARNLTLQIDQWEPWGAFDPEEIKNLREKGVYIKLYQIPQKEIKELPEGLVIKAIFRKSGIVHSLVAGQKEFSLSFKEVSLPRMGLEAMRQRLLKDREVLEELKLDLQKACDYYQALMKIKKRLEKELEFQEAMRGMGEAGELAYVTGYLPFDVVLALSDLAKKERWGISIAEPSEEDSVPTLIRNKRWVSFISPVFKLIEVVPGYREFDISLWFLIFLSVFFGILIGDAGYGIIYLALTFWLQRKFGHKLKNKAAFYLFYILSVCAVIWGVLTATFFGQGWLKSYVTALMPALTDDIKVRKTCFFIGATHLSIAHLWRMIVQLPHLVALTEAGWICILWSAFFLAKFLILGEAAPLFLKWLLLTGIILVIIFSHPRKNILKGIGQGLGTLLLNLMNNFTDVVSYIRLFAVGLATVAVADAFNAMAGNVGFKGMLAGLLSSLILVTGHGLNLLLGPMSVLVHGIRLNVLEFCSHLDVKWSGFLYKPLKEETL